MKTLLGILALPFLLLALVQVWAWPGLILYGASAFSAITAYRPPPTGILTTLAKPSLWCLGVACEIYYGPNCGK